MILVTDDDDGHRTLTIHKLQKLYPGADVQGTDNLQTLLELVRVNQHRVAGVVTDNEYFDKPLGADHRTKKFLAKETIKKVKEIGPDTPVVVYSIHEGLAEDPYIQQNAVFILKYSDDQEIDKALLGAFRHKLTL